jgi:hypothetical protein
MWLFTSRQLREHLPTAKDTLSQSEELSAGDIAAMQETRGCIPRCIWTQDDTKAKRAEAARKKRERAEHEAKNMEWGRALSNVRRKTGVSSKGSE